MITLFHRAFESYNNPPGVHILIQKSAGFVCKTLDSVKSQLDSFCLSVLCESSQHVKTKYDLFDQT